MQPRKVSDEIPKGASYGSALRELTVERAIQQPHTDSSDKQSPCPGATDAFSQPSPADIHCSAIQRIWIGHGLCTRLGARLSEKSGKQDSASTVQLTAEGERETNKYLIHFNHAGK